MSSELKVGSLFAQRYRVIRCIGAGGMGAVYEAHHIHMDLHVAVKVMQAHAYEQAVLRERFSREARVAAGIRSEHVVQVFDAGFDEQTQMPYLAMELLVGKDLEWHLQNTGRFSPEEALQYLHQTALALDAMQRKSVVHRDLKPANLFLAELPGRKPLVKVLDFGLAKVLDDASKGGETAQFGTYLYMAPEQFQGQVSAATDVHALGMIAYALLVGEPYWAPEWSNKHGRVAFMRIVVDGLREEASVRARKRANISLPSGFDQWFERATAHLPEDRFQSALAAVRVLADVLELPRPPELDPVSPALPAETFPVSVPSPPEVGDTAPRTATGGPIGVGPSGASGPAVTNEPAQQLPEEPVQASDVRAEAEPADMLALPPLPGPRPATFLVADLPAPEAGNTAPKTATGGPIVTSLVEDEPVEPPPGERPGEVLASALGASRGPGRAWLRRQSALLAFLAGLLVAGVGGALVIAMRGEPDSHRDNQEPAPHDTAVETPRPVTSQRVPEPTPEKTTAPMETSPPTATSAPKPAPKEMSEARTEQMLEEALEEIRSQAAQKHFKKARELATKARTVPSGESSRRIRTLRFEAAWLAYELGQIIDNRAMDVGETREIHDWVKKHIFSRGAKLPSDLKPDVPIRIAAICALVDKDRDDCFANVDLIIRRFPPDEQRPIRAWMNGAMRCSGGKCPQVSATIGETPKPEDGWEWFYRNPDKVLSIHLTSLPDALAAAFRVRAAHWSRELVERVKDDAPRFGGASMAMAVTAIRLCGDGHWPVAKDLANLVIKNWGDENDEAPASGAMRALVMSMDAGLHTCDTTVTGASRDADPATHGGARPDGGATPRAAGAGSAKP